MSRAPVNICLNCRLFRLGSVIPLIACVQVSVVSELPARPPRTLPIDVRVENCVDRTETRSRDLALDATEAFRKELRASEEFVIKNEARFRLACDVSGFVEGSAIERWIMPGSGATVGQVSAMLTDTSTGEIVIIARGNATVSAGGLYTIRADKYILASAVDDVFRQLRAWAVGGTPDSIKPPGNTIERR